MAVTIRENIERELTDYVDDLNSRQMDALDRAKMLLPDLMDSVPAEDPLWNLFRKNKWRDMGTYAAKNWSRYPRPLVRALMDASAEPIDVQDFVDVMVTKMKGNFPIVQKAVSNAASAADVDVTIIPEVRFQNVMDFGDYVVSAFTLRVNGIDVSLFVEDGKLQVDDIPEDFEDVESTPEAFWGLQKFIKEMQSPRSSRSSRKLVLYTARPAKDRARYVNANTVPPGIFLTNSEDHAQGLAEEYGARELYRVVIEEKYLLKTLDGRVKYYQVMGDRPVPVVIEPI